MLSYTDSEKKTKCFYLSVALCEAIKKIARQQKRSESFIAEELLSKAVEDHEEEASAKVGC